MGKVIQLPRSRKLEINVKENNVIVGDCIEWLKHIPSNSIDMCYIDPPFFSNKNYEIIWGNGYEARSFGDRWKGGVKSYIVWMDERVKEIYRVLKPTGSIFLHCDHHASHRLRVMLDDGFGEDNFINEIIWCYKSGGASKKHFSKKHDNIFFYAKDKRKYLENFKIKKNEKSYMAPGSGKNPAQKYYEDDNGSYTLVYPKDWWDDIGILATSAKERIGYRTQKPEALLKKIIECSTKENDLVLDCFGGGYYCLSC